MSDTIHIQGKQLATGLLCSAALALAFAATGNFALIGVGAAIGINLTIILSVKREG